MVGVCLALFVLPFYYTAFLSDLSGWLAYWGAYTSGGADWALIPSLVLFITGSGTGSGEEWEDGRDGEWESYDYTSDSTHTNADGFTFTFSHTVFSHDYQYDAKSGMERFITRLAHVAAGFITTDRGAERYLQRHASVCIAIGADAVATAVKVPMAVRAHAAALAACTISGPEVYSAVYAAACAVCDADGTPQPLC